MFCNTTGHPIISRTWFYNGIEVQNRLNYLNYNVNHIKYTFFLGDDSKQPVKKVTFFWWIGFVLRKFITIWLKAKKKKKERKKTEVRKFDFPSFPHLIFEAADCFMRVTLKLTSLSGQSLPTDFLSISRMVTWKSGTFGWMTSVFTSAWQKTS